MTPAKPRTVDRIVGGQHACSLVGDGSTIVETSATFLATAPSRGQRPVLVGHPATADGVRRCLGHEMPLHAPAPPRPGAGGNLDPLDLVDLLDAQLEAAREEGFAGIRAAVEVAALLSDEPSGEEVAQLEAKLGRFFATGSGTGLSLYDVEAVAPELLLAASSAHPLLAVGTAVYPNLYHEPTARDGEQNPAGRLLESRLRTLRDHQRDADALLENEELYTNIVESMSDGVVVLDRDGGVKYWNPAMDRIFNLVRETGDAPGGLLPSSIVDGMEPLIAQALSGRVVERGDIPRRQPDGATVYTNESYLPLRSATGEIRGVVGVIRDITSRRRAEEQLRAQRELLTRIMDAASACMTVTDAEGQICYANARAEELLGLRKDALSAHTYDTPDWQVTDEGGGPVAGDDLPHRQVIRARGAVHGLRQALRWPDGRRLDLAVDGAPVFGDDGQVDLVVLTIEPLPDSGGVATR